MGVSKPREGYARMVAYAQHKTELRLDQLILQAFMAGFWVAVIGHCCTITAAAFYNQLAWYSGGLTKVIYGILFPGAFVAVVYTGTELYTGNTVAMIMLVLDRGTSQLMSLIRIWTFSLVGNCAGAVFGALLLSYGSRQFAVEGSQNREFLFSMVEHKVSYDWGEAFCLAIGCNLLVCLCTWCVIISDDGAGKILAMFYTIGVFAMGGYEHIVANFYTISAGYMYGYDGHSFGHAVLYNWLPVWLGNTVAGSFLTGCMWWYALHPDKEAAALAPYSDQDLVAEVVRRQSFRSKEFRSATGLNTEVAAAPH